MKRNFILFLLLMLSVLFISSCARGFNPMYYYNKRTESLSGGDSSNNPPPTPPEEIPEDEDPFKVDNDYNKPDYGGYDASQFDKWLFKVSFRGDKLPIYVFFDDSSRAWSSGALDWRNKSADFYKANDGENKVYGTVVGDVNITSLKIYKYNKENPLYDSIGYLPGRMDRFRFYSIDGEASVSPLKQYLIAVDTYSKFVFAFGAITGTKNVAGDDVPIEFEAIEYHADKKHFYEYDPIGYVDKSGSVVLYQHYEEEFVKVPTSYVPKQHGYDNYAEHNKFKPGKSPYVPLNNNTEATPEQKEQFESSIKEFVGKTFKWRDYIGYQKSPTGDKDQINLEEWKNAGYAGKSLILYTYKLENNASTLTITEEDYNSGEKKTRTYNMSLVNTEYKATYTNTVDSSESISITIVKNDSGNNTISVSGTVLDENFQDYGPIFVDRVKNAVFDKRGNTSIPPGGTFTHSMGETVNGTRYEFNEDGTEFTLILDGIADDSWGDLSGNQVTKKYYFKLARFDSDAPNTWAAKYECTNLSGTLGKYSRVVLRKDGSAIINGAEKDTMIRSSMTLHSIDFWEDPKSDAGLLYDAYRENK